MNLKQQTQFGAIWLKIENMNFQIEMYFVVKNVAPVRCIQNKTFNFYKQYFRLANNHPIVEFCNFCDYILYFCCLKF